MSPQVKLYRVFNNRSQPVELHFGQQVIVIPPNGMLELDETILAAEQVQRLHQSGAISATPVELAPKPELRNEEKHKDKETSKHSKPHNGSNGEKKKRKH